MLRVRTHHAWLQDPRVTKAPGDVHLLHFLLPRDICMLDNTLESTLNGIEPVVTGE